MDVSIIIVNYNTKDLTKKCIESVIKYTTNILYEIILVDNASMDGSKELFEKDIRIKYIYNSTNDGFGKANNLGLKYSSGKYVFLLNSDTILMNNAVYQFYKAMENDGPLVACMGCVLEDINGQPIKSFGPFLTPNIIIPKHIKQFISGSIPPSGVIVPVVLGADLFIRKSVIQRYGLFDPAFFMYHEENDLQRRYFQAGYVSKIIAGPRIIHLEGRSNIHKINTHMVEGAYTYMRKWLPLYKYILFYLSYALTRTPKVFISP